MQDKGRRYRKVMVYSLVIYVCLNLFVGGVGERGMWQEGIIGMQKRDAMVEASAGGSGRVTAESVTTEVGGVTEENTTTEIGNVTEEGSVSEEVTTEEGTTEETTTEESLPVEISLSCKDGILVAADEIVCNVKISNVDMEKCSVEICVNRTKPDGSIEETLLDKETFETGVEQQITFREEGVYQVSVKVKQENGDVTKSEPVGFSIDKTPPEISEITYSDVTGPLRERYHNIYSNNGILVEFAVTDRIAGVAQDGVYITLGRSLEETEKGIVYIPNKGPGDYYYLYVPADLKVSEFSDTITVWAKDKLSHESHRQSAPIIYRKAKPEIAMECEAGYEKWSNEDVTFHTMVTDNVAGLQEIVYKVNGTTVKKKTFETLTFSYDYDVVAMEETNKISGYTVTVEATNNCGVKKTMKRQVYIDKTKPTVVLSGIENGAHYNTNQTVVVDVEDVSYKNTRIQYYVTRTLDGERCQVSFEDYLMDGYKARDSHQLTEEGSYEIYAVATDGAGNVRKTNTLSFVIDKTAPEVKLSGVEEGEMSGKTVALQFECQESFFATNRVEVVVERRLDGKTTTQEIKDIPKNGKLCNWQQRFEEDGTYQVSIASQDKAGNVAISKSIVFSVDKTKPQICIRGTDNYQMWGRPITVNFSVEESFYKGNEVIITGTRRDIDGKEETLQMPSFTSTSKRSSLSQQFQKDGIYKLQVVAKDSAGNQNSQKVHFVIDRSAPEINRVAQFDGGCYTYFKLADSMEEIFRDLTMVSYRMWLNGLEYNGMDTVTREGKYHLYVEAVDELGHKATQDIEFMVQAPSAQMLDAKEEDGEVNQEVKQAEIEVSTTAMVETPTAEEPHAEDDSRWVVVCVAVGAVMAVIGLTLLCLFIKDEKDKKGKDKDNDKSSGI